MRRALQAGTGRTLTTLVMVIGVVTFVTWQWPRIGQKLLDSGPKIAFLAAAFSVTAYNLRTRVVDLILKIEAPPERTKFLCDIARACGTRLTNLVLIFTVSAIMMGVIGCLNFQSVVSPWVVTVAWALFMACCVQFVYVIFAFERLERFMLDDAEARAEQTEKERLLQVADASLD